MVWKVVSIFQTPTRVPTIVPTDNAIAPIFIGSFFARVAIPPDKTKDVARVRRTRVIDDRPLKTSERIFSGGLIPILMGVTVEGKMVANDCGMIVGVITFGTDSFKLNHHCPNAGIRAIAARHVLMMVAIKASVTSEQDFPAGDCSLALDMSC